MARFLHHVNEPKHYLKDLNIYKEMNDETNNGKLRTVKSMKNKEFGLAGDLIDIGDNSFHTKFSEHENIFKKSFVIKSDISNKHIRDKLLQFN